MNYFAIRVNIADRGARYLKEDGSITLSRPGHVWYTLINYQTGAEYNFGFHPSEDGEFYTNPGMVRVDDDKRYLDVAYQKTFPISGEIYNEIYNFSQDARANNTYGRYFGPGHACIQFTYAAFASGGIYDVSLYVDSGGPPSLWPANNKPLFDTLYNSWMSKQGRNYVYSGDGNESPTSRLNKADTNNITYDLTLTDSSAATTINPASTTRSDPMVSTVTHFGEENTHDSLAQVSGVEVADFNKKFQELWEYNYGIQLGPMNPAGIDYEEGEISEEQAAEYKLVREQAWKSSGIVAVEEMRAYLAKLAFAFSKELSNADPSPSEGPLYASLASDYQTYSVGAPPASSDPFSMLRMAIFGHDNPELANNQFKKAVNDTIYKDIYPLMLTLAQVGNTAAVGTVVTPFLAPTAAAPGNFVIEVAKKKSENYDRPNYTWESAFIDAGKQIGIDLAVGMGAQKMSQAIAAKFNLAEPARVGLEESLDYLLKKGVDQILENN